MSYRYETHCHSAEGSACSVISIRDMVHLYHENGYSGLCIADHFSGNSALSDELTWKERVQKHWDICEEGRREGEKLGFKVFFGMEYSLIRYPGQLRRILGNDFVLLGLDKEWWMEQEGIFDLPPVECFRKIREAGGFIIHAHPFLEAPWVDYIRLLPRSVDAVEVINGPMNPKNNESARIYAETYGLLKTAGTDLHRKEDAVYMSGVECDTPCDTVQELICAIREGRATPFQVPRE